MAMLALPLVFVDLSSDRISVKENRMLAERPKLADIKNHPGRFIRGFDAWFNDSTGFREPFVGLYRAMNNNRWLNSQYMYTDGSYTYLFGEYGHQYFAHVDGFLIQKYQGKQFLSDDQLQGMASKLEEVKTYLDNKGIPLVVMFCTDKESIYPEFYPKSIKRGPEPIQLDVITSYLQENTSVDIFNIKQTLLAEKKNYLLYYIIDTMSFTDDFAHYNQIGAFFAYRELMKHINIHFPQIIPYELNDIEINYDEKERPHVSFKADSTYELIDDSPLIYENADSEQLVILFLHDSYSAEGYIGKFFAQQFGKAIFVHYANIANFEEYITKYEPDIVVFESAERELRGFANCVIGIPELQ